MSIKNKIIKILGGYTFDYIAKMAAEVVSMREELNSIITELEYDKKYDIIPVGAYLEVPEDVAKAMDNEQIRKKYRSYLASKLAKEIMQNDLAKFIVNRTQLQNEQECTAALKIYVAKKRKDDNDE